MDKIIEASSLVGVSSGLEAMGTRRLGEALQEANSILDTSLGIISRVDGQDYVIEYVAGSSETVSRGARFELGKTFCSITLESDSLLAISHAGQSEYTGHPCYQAFPVEAYIGIPISLSSGNYGTLNFTSTKPRQTPWTDKEKALLRIIRSLISSKLERKRAQQKFQELTLSLEQSNKKLARRNEQLTTFAHALSHDLGQPIRALGGLSKILKQSAANKLDAGEKQYLDYIVESSHRIRDLTDSMLQFMKVGTGASVEQVCLEKVVKTTLHDLAPEISASAAVVQKDPLPTVSGVLWQVQLVFKNLLLNSIKYRDPEAPLQIAIEHSQGKGRHEILVRDNGLGIPEYEADRLFQAFSRLSSAKGKPGSGLGLSIVQRVMEGLGGSIELLPLDKPGAVFRLVFPRQPEV